MYCCGHFLKKESLAFLSKCTSAGHHSLRAQAFDTRMKSCCVVTLQDCTASDGSGPSSRVSKVVVWSDDSSVPHEV